MVMEYATTGGPTMTMRHARTPAGMALALMLLVEEAATSVATEAVSEMSPVAAGDAATVGGAVTAGSASARRRPV